MTFTSALPVCMRHGPTKRSPLRHQRFIVVIGSSGVEAGYDPRLAQLTRARVDEHRPAEDVDRPERHRSQRTKSAALRRRGRAAARPCRARVRLTVEREGSGRPPQARASARARSAARAPLRVPAAQLADERLELAEAVVGQLRGRCERSTSPARPSPVAGQPRVQRLARHTHLGDLAPSPHRRHRPVALLDNRHNDQRQSRPPAGQSARADHGRRQASIEAQLLRHNCQASPGTGQRSDDVGGEHLLYHFKGAAFGRAGARLRGLAALASSPAPQDDRPGHDLGAVPRDVLGRGAASADRRSASRRPLRGSLRSGLSASS